MEQHADIELVVNSRDIPAPPPLPAFLREKKTVPPNIDSASYLEALKQQLDQETKDILTELYEAVKKDEFMKFDEKLRILRTVSNDQVIFHIQKVQKKKNRRHIKKAFSKIRLPQILYLKQA